jgi:uncharacterized membrane protein
MLYLILKLVHVLAVIVFLGNIIVGAFWKAQADRTRDPRVIAHTLSGIILADRIFTIPAVIVLFLAGFATAGIGHINVFTTGWTLWGLGLFIIAGICFGPVSRAQRALRDLTAAAASGGSLDWEQYERVSRTWNVFGTIATIVPLIAVAIMIIKPVLPAF